MTHHRIMVASGDGIGPEVTREALVVLDAVARRFEHTFDIHEEVVGGAALDRYGTPLASGAIERAAEVDAVLFGAVGDPKYDGAGIGARPEQAILQLRRGLGLFANLRPIRVSEALLDAGPLRPEIARGTDLIVVRELTGGIYFGRPQGREDGVAVDTMRYSEPEIRRILHVGFELARARRSKLTSVDKANVLACSKLWRELAEDVAHDYPDVELEHVLVDACAMHLVRSPTRFDVIVTANMFGDILTDEAAAVAGSLGLMPSASLGVRRDDGTYLGLYEPIHGSAPDIAGRGIANPVGAISSTAMMLRLSLGLVAEAEAIEAAVDTVLARGPRTPDLATEGHLVIGTAQLGAAIAEAVANAR